MQDNWPPQEGRALLAPEHQLRHHGLHRILESPRGAVQLNGAAADVLALCDGTRTAQEIVKNAAAATHEGLAGDVVAFLDAARRRGWITLQ
jgi:pyrroloquinoline quinone biosynthesis protein D